MKQNIATSPQIVWAKKQRNHNSKRMLLLSRRERVEYQKRQAQKLCKIAEKLGIGVVFTSTTSKTSGGQNV